MWTNAHEAYLEDRILSADRTELVRMLYASAMEAVRTARVELAAGRIAGRARAVNKAYRILSELVVSLDKDRGGQIAERLSELYDYMMRRLNEANFRQQDEPLAEVLGLLNTLAEAWAAVIQETASKNARSESWENSVNQSGSYGMSGYTPQPNYAAQSWSF